MPRNDIGGFFVSLGLQPDKNSFETGNKLIDAVSTSLNKLIGTARNAAVVLAGTAVASGAVESANYKTATAIGISTEKLDVWKASAKIAGVNADGLVGSMGKLANVMNHMTIDGSGLEAYAKQLGELGMGFDELEGLDPADAYQKIIATAQSKLDGTNMTRITTIVGDILGSEGQNLFIELTRQGKTIGEFLTGAQKTVFTDSLSNQKAQNFNVEINTLKTSIESIGKLLGSEVGGVMTPYIKSLNDWIQQNGPTIKDAISKIAEAIAKIVGKIVDAPKVVRTHNEIQKDIDAWMKTNGKKKIPGINNTKFSELPEDLQAEILEFKKDHPLYSFEGIYGVPKVQDGILRPDGTITQVAPDDWVLAARNLGDLARAFIPQGIGAGMQLAEYSIVQNFTINGGSDLPQVLRQQAYNGVQEGLLAVMNQSSQRLQMMSGTR